MGFDVLTNLNHTNDSYNGTFGYNPDSSSKRINEFNKSINKQLGQVLPQQIDKSKSQALIPNLTSSKPEKFENRHQSHGRINIVKSTISSGQSSKIGQNTTLVQSGGPPAPSTIQKPKFGSKASQGKLNDMGTIGNK